MRYSYYKKIFYHNDRVMPKDPWQKLFSLFALCLLCLAIATPARTNERTYQLSTGISSGNFYPVSIAIKTLLTLKRSDDHHVILDVHQSKGAQANLIALLEGKADIAFVDAATILAAVTKKPPFEKYTNIGELQALASLWPDVAHFIIRQPEVNTGNVSDFRNLIGESVSLGPKTSASAYAAHNLFSKIGIYYDKMFRLPDYGIYQSTDAFINEAISGAALFTHNADKNIERILANTNSDAMLLHIDDQHFKKLIQTEIPVWERHIIEANTYTNQPNPIRSISQANFLVVRQSFDRDDAYFITKTLFENLTFVSALHDAAKNISRTKSSDELILPLHPGSKKYFIESEECKGIFCLFN